MGNFCSALREKGGGDKVLPVSAVSQLPSAPNNQHAKAAYFGVACSDLLHWPPIKTWKVLFLSLQLSRVFFKEGFGTLGIKITLDERHKCKIVGLPQTN